MFDETNIVDPSTIIFFDETTAEVAAATPPLPRLSEEGDGGNSGTLPSPPPPDDAPAHPKGGRPGGEGADPPPPPPLPPSEGVPDPVVASTRKPVSTPPSRRVIGEVYTPAAAENPVLTALKAEDLFEKTFSPGVHQVICPWCHEHDQPGVWYATYREPDDTRRHGGFFCSHPHRAKLNIGSLLDALDIEPAVASGKAVIRVLPGEMHRVADAAEQVLATFPDHYQFGNQLVRVRIDDDTGDVRTEPLNDGSLAKVLSAGARWLRWDGQKQIWVPIDPPPRHVAMLLKAQEHKYLPILKGLARQPYMLQDGSVVRTAGYDPDAQTFGAFRPDEFLLPEPTEAAAREALASLKALVAEFHLQADHDRSASVAAMLTAAMRSQLPLAPAFNISASMSGSGKSYLAGLIALFAGPGQPMNVSYPVKAEEAGKAILTMLMTQPAVVLFDDMQTNWIPHSIINRMLTSEVVSDRKLGSNESAKVSTATLVLGTGNNVVPDKDMRRRVISVYLAPQSDSPATLTYAGDPTGTVRADRGRYVGNALTIVRAWIAAGRPMADVPEIGSYGVWSDLCRQPLLWLGEADPATSLIEQVESDPEADALAVFLKAWHMEFGTNSVMLRTVVDRAMNDSDGDLWQSMQELPFMGAKDVDRNRFGHYLRKNVNRFSAGLTLVKGDCSERNAWAVVPAGIKPSGFERDARPKGYVWSKYNKTAAPTVNSPVAYDPDEIF